MLLNPVLRTAILFTFSHPCHSAVSVHQFSLYIFTNVSCVLRCSTYHSITVIMPFHMNPCGMLPIMLRHFVHHRMPTVVTTANVIHVTTANTCLHVYPISSQCNLYYLPLVVKVDVFSSSCEVVEVKDQDLFCFTCVFCKIYK